jgi:hypothetical protein
MATPDLANNEKKMNLNPRLVIRPSGEDNALHPETVDLKKYLIILSRSPVRKLSFP